MIAVYLEEKYRLVLRLERESEEKEVREMRRKVKSGKSVEELKIRKGGKHVRSQRRSSNEARRNLVLKAGPAKAVRFIVDHKARGEVQDADKTSSAEVIDYDTRPMSPERPFVLRGSLPKHNSLQTIKDLDDFTAEREQRALQANLHLDIERQLYIDAAYSHRDVTASRTSSPCQQSSGRIENVGSWEHMSYDRHY